MNECSGGTKDNCWRGQTTSVSGLGGKHLMVIARPVEGVGSNANGCFSAAANFTFSLSIESGWN